MANPASSGDSRIGRRRATEQEIAGDYKYVTWVFYGVLSFGLLFITLWIKPSDAMVALTWAMACFVSGGAFGFIFGVPKVLQQGAAQASGPSKNGVTAQDAGGYRQEVNTNLTEISDWLTKMIVGVGLVNLKEIPQFVKTVAMVLAVGMSKSDNTRDFLPYAIGLIVFFTVLGFLFGYLSTRLYLAPAFARADVSATGASGLQALAAEVAGLQEVVSALVVPPTLMEVVDAKADSSKELVLATAQRALEADGIRDVGQRVAAKDQAANEIARLVLSGAISRDWLVEEASQQTADHRQDALVAGLAVAINLAPQPGDLQRLTKVSTLTLWPHTRHKICGALGKLFSARIATRSEVRDAEQMLAHFLEGADEPLQRRVRETAALIARSTGATVELPDS
jgi:hypothetical protein